MAEAAPDQHPTILVFIHVPKTAGTTLRAVLNMNEPGSRTRGLGNVFKGGGGLDEGLIERLRKEKGPKLRGVRILRGHFPLGIREYLPAHLPKDRSLRCFTFLRDPVDRTLSHYFAIRERRNGSYRLPPLPADATLDDALEGGYLHDNLHTRMLSGLPEPFGEVTDEMLEQAKHNLREELVFFGLTERFDESLVLAKQRLGFRSILYNRGGRVNTARPRGDEVPEELIRSAERCNRYDMELYRYAEELFDSAPELAQLDFEVELAALRAAKAGGEIELEGPPPAGFAGDEEAWRMLIGARAAVLSVNWEFRRRHVPEIPATIQDEALEVEFEGARSKIEELEQQVEHLEEARSRIKELELEVEDLEEARSRIKELELEVEDLKDTRSRLKGRLERQAERVKRGKQKARPRPKRNAKHGGPKRSDARRAKARASDAAQRKRQKSSAMDASGEHRVAEARARRKAGQPPEGSTDSDQDDANRG